MQGLLQRVAQLSLQRTRLSGDTTVATCHSLLNLVSRSAAPHQHAALATASSGEHSLSTAWLIIPDSYGCSSPADAAGSRCDDAGRHATLACRLSGLSAPAAGLRDLRPAAVGQLAGVAQQSSGLHSSAHARAPTAGNATGAAGIQPPPGKAPIGKAAAQNVPTPPWTPTKDLAKRKTLPKRMGHMLQVLEDEKVKEALAARNIPDFGPGDVLEVKMAIPENKRRVVVTKGLCIARRNRAFRTSFTIRNHLGAAGGIERTFPLFSPHIEQITLLSRRKVRRAKLYYLRNRQPKEFRVN